MIGFTLEEIELMPESYQLLYLCDLALDGVGDQHDVDFILENTWVEFNLEASQSFERCLEDEECYDE